MTGATTDPDALAAWVGRQETAEDVIDPRPARLMQATLDRPVMLGPGDALPPLWHWLYFPAEIATGALGPDGHPARGGFLPPVALPRRMWAGGRFAFTRPLRLGETARRTSTIESVEVKTGRSGTLCFVTVRHEFAAGGAPRFTEWHDIVYRGEGAPGRPPAAPDLPVRRTVTPSMPLLFRYSALTFNGHRIHYDADYCREVEGYPGCVVHGPLTATLLAGLAGELLDAPLARFAFRATAPLFADAPFTLAGRAEAGRADLAALTPEGGQAMRAEAEAA